MTAAELLAYQIDNGRFQLEKVLEGLPDEHRDYKSCPAAMTPRETIGHLCETYQAVVEVAQGKKFPWGAYQPPADWNELWLAMLDFRKKAADFICRGDDHRLKLGLEFIVEHDSYHTGQLALVRLSTDPAWDPYSLYRPVT